MGRKINKNKGIGVIIVARNEALKLPDCLKSVNWADEIVVIDNDSTDDTAKIAKLNGAKVYSIKEGNFSERKNFAIRKSDSPYILFLDADERVTEELHKEIMDNVVSENYAAYAIPRRNIILGYELRNGGWWPDYVIRLFKREAFKGFKGLLHEQPEFRGDLKHLKNPLVHLKHDNFEEMVDKTNEWSGIEAKLMLDANHPPMNIPRFITAVLREAYLRIIKEKAYKDKTPGMIYAFYQVVSRFLSYAKLWEMQRK